ncbi:dipeptidase [Yunchengibacter salinarum]|uniref:dipeptidase n=1 Tax=Yunchengibacter salinarum TaxID=3133399 RepID=UPI0035B6A33D
MHPSSVHIWRRPLAALSLLALAACGNGADNDTADQANMAETARKLALETIIVDGHIDVPYRLNRNWVDVSTAAPDGDFDHPRAEKGGLNAPFMSIYTPAEYGDSQKATDHANAMIDIVERIVSEAPDKFAIAKSVAEVQAITDAGKIALPLGMENGSPINGSLDLLKHFHDRGIRYITLAHSKSNHLSDSSYDPERQWDGLSDFGRTVVQEMNDLGIMVDVSHLSDKAIEDVLETSRAPVIASHSSVRAFTPGFERNLSDPLIKAIANKGGVVMINYGSAFVTARANGYRPARTEAYMTYLDREGLDDTQKVREAFEKRYREDNPYPYADISDVVDHIDHVVDLVGIEHVGLGSDYDGVGDSLPTGLKDVSSYPDLVERLLGRGYSEEDIKLILSGNALRVWQQVETIAAEAQADAA